MRSFEIYSEEPTLMTMVVALQLVVEGRGFISHPHPEKQFFVEQ